MMRSTQSGRPGELIPRLRTPIPERAHARHARDRSSSTHSLHDALPHLQPPFIKPTDLAELELTPGDAVEIRSAYDAVVGISRNRRRPEARGRLDEPRGSSNAPSRFGYDSEGRGAAGGPVSWSAHVCTTEPLSRAPNLGSEHRTLYRCNSPRSSVWLRCGRRGVIEGRHRSGRPTSPSPPHPTRVAGGRFVLVVVPSRVLMEQWHGTAHRRAARGSDRSVWATAGRTGRRRATCCRDPGTRRRRTSPCRP